MSSPSEQFQDAHERHQAAGEHGPRWVPLAAAILAVLAALSGFLSDLRSTAALVDKNDAIIATTHASDTYAQYQAGRIKYYVYQAALDAGTAHDTAKLAATAAAERSKGAPLQRKAASFEAQAARFDERSQRLLGAHEILEVATTLFEVSIVLVSITALVGSRLLPVVAATASALGLVVFLIGALR